MTSKQDSSDRKATEALSDLLAGSSAPIGQVNVILASRMDGKLHYRWLPLKKPDAKAPEQSAAKQFAKVLEKGLSMLKDGYEGAELCSHRATVPPAPGQLEYIDLGSAGGASLRDSLKPLLEAATVPNFDGAAAFLDGLRFYVISTTVAGSPLRAFRLLSPKMELARSGRFALIGDGKGGAYDLLRDKVLLFDKGVDCLLWADRLYILNRTPFQQMFDYYEVLERQMDATLGALKDLELIDEFDQFKKDARGIASRTKLADMAEAPLIQQATLDKERGVAAALPGDYWERVEEVIRMFGLGVRVVRAAGATRLEYEPGRRWELLRLLADDYLVSPQAPQPTERGYLASFKQPKPLRFAVEVRRAAAVPIPAAGARKGPRRAPRRPGAVAAASVSPSAAGAETRTGTG